MKIVSGRTGSPHVTSQQFRQMLEGIIGQGSCKIGIPSIFTPHNHVAVGIFCVIVVIFGSSFYDRNQFIVYGCNTIVRFCQFAT